ncbi:MAG TPA: helix-turn-helix transcriptional regulator [Candidatus Angelobacter sp.]|nr:helix-turn-helix transcriptional regulator [Candidatus Angelobacter sp.]
MRKSKLSPKDIEICKRFLAAREMLGRSQSDVASQLSLKHTTLQNYERCRTPLRFEVALRFCRQFIVSEEWLATGKYAACWAAAPLYGVKPGPGKEHFEKLIFRRQCVDLLSEPATLHVRPGTLFGDAYEILSAHYRRLVAEHFFLPRIVVTDSDIPELGVNFLTVVNERFIAMLANESPRRDLPRSAGWRRYTRFACFASQTIFRRMMMFPLSARDMDSEDMNWLRYISTDQAAKIPFIGEEQGHKSLAPRRTELATESKN